MVPGRFERSPRTFAGHSPKSESKLRRGRRRVLSDKDLGRSSIKRVVQLRRIPACAFLPRRLIFIPRSWREPNSKLLMRNGTFHSSAVLLRKQTDKWQAARLRVIMKESCTIVDIMTVTTIERYCATSS